MTGGWFLVQGGAEPYWIVPDPTTTEVGGKVGCQNLPEGLTFESARFYWNETAGKDICKFVWFFFEPGCTGDARGVEVIPVPQLKGVPWVSQDPILSRTTYWKIMNGKSIGCSFRKPLAHPPIHPSCTSCIPPVLLGPHQLAAAPCLPLLWNRRSLRLSPLILVRLFCVLRAGNDPCEAFPCADPNAKCESSWGWSWEGISNQQRNCSVCKEGFAMGPDGKCATPKGESPQKD